MEGAIGEGGALEGGDLVERDETRQERSLLELEGMGAEIWKGLDAQAYVNDLRQEWDQDAQG